MADSQRWQQTSSKNVSRPRDVNRDSWGLINSAMMFSGGADRNDPIGNERLGKVKGWMREREKIIKIFIQVQINSRTGRSYFSDNPSRRTPKGEIEHGKITTPTGFEPVPPKGSDFESDVLDHSTTAPITDVICQCI